MIFHILSTNLQLLQTVAALIDQGEGYPVPGGQTLHHALPETRHDGLEYALLADDVAAEYIGMLVASLTNNAGNAEQVAQDWQELQNGVLVSVEYTIPTGAFAGESVRIAQKGAEWTPPNTMKL